jgi:very-short-patch-repair endonuclease
MKTLTQHEDDAKFQRLMGRVWLWRYGLRAGQTVGPWAPAFVSRKRRLIVEIDNPKDMPRDSLGQEKYWERESSRDMNLYRKGYSVLHIHIDDIREHAEETRVMVREWAKNPKRYYEQQAPVRESWRKPSSVAGSRPRRR